MADLFVKQAKKYSETRPTYPPELYRFITSKCSGHTLAWDVGTGNGQAAIPLAGMFDKVIATDSSETQLSHATPHVNIKYHHTNPAIFSPSTLFDPHTVDLITVAQAIHWLDMATFYSQARLLLRPNGVIAAWCYTLPHVNPEIDRLLIGTIFAASSEYWAPQRRYVDEELRTIEFPFKPVEGENGTGPFEFTAEQEMTFVGLLDYIRSWSAYETAKGRGVELLGKEVITEFEKAWGPGGVKVVKFPLSLRIGKV